MKNQKNKDNIILYWQTTAMVLVVVFTFFVAFDRGVIDTSSTASDLQEGGTVVQSEETGQEEVESDRTIEALPEIIPTGVPAVYGAELEINYDDVSPNDPRKADETIAVMANIDRTVELSGNGLARYINILYHMEEGMSCEFCCGARSVIFEDGSAACGCAHSFAMRGLTKHLILNTEMGDEEILSEVGKWKVLFFPDIHVQKASLMQEQELKTDYISLTANVNRGMETGTAGGMVGGC